MGFQRSALLLEWDEGTEFAGLEVRVKRMSIRQMLHIDGLSDLSKGSSNEETAQAMGDLLDAVAGGLLSWNYEEEVKQDDGSTVSVPVPATREALDDIDLDMILALVQAWTRAAAAVPLVSPPSSPTGEPVPPDEEWASFLASSQQPSGEHVSS